MKKLLAILLLSTMLSSCVKPMMDKSQYTIIDTTDISINGFGVILGYDVLIKIDSTTFSGYISSDGELIEINRKLKPRQ